MIQIESKSFSGPMDLLLDLLNRSEIDIYDIEISSITEQFLVSMQEIAISSEELSSFIRMATTLVAMKARTLLKDQFIDEEDDVLTKDELIQRLIEYRFFKKVSEILSASEGKNNKLLRKLPEDLKPFVKDEEDEIIIGDAEILKNELFNVLKRKKKSEDDIFKVDQVLNSEEYSLSEVENTIREKLKSGKRFTFIDLLDDEIFTKPKLIIVFLSLLELTKTQELTISQKDGSKEIFVDYLGENNGNK